VKKQVRAEVFLRDGFVCKKCGTAGSKRNPLTIHHIMPKSKYPKLVNDPDNCQVLCRECYDIEHGVSRGEARTKKRTRRRRYWEREMTG